MVIYTHTERLRKNRKLIVELLLAAHCRDCTTCDKHGRCKLQKLAYQLGINNVRFENHREIQPVDFSSPAIVRDPNKCILCGCCVPGVLGASGDRRSGLWPIAARTLP